jgi:hypothetical protein
MMMKIQFNKTKTSTIALVLTLTISATFVALPIVSAHEPPWEVPTHAYIVVAPDPIGVGQQLFVVYWLNWIPIGAGGVGGDRWTNLTIEITAPDNSKETFGPYISDPIGGGYLLYTPTQVGTYHFKFSFPGQVASKYNPVTGLESVNPSRTEYLNDTFLPSSAETTATVQQEPIERLPGTPLPTEYWTRPIDGQNTGWFKVASNWVAGNTLVHGNFQPVGTAPNSPHIMWTKPLQDGGVVGGSYPVEGMTYYTGDSYEPRFEESIIINGRLYYVLPLNHGGGARTVGGGYMCVDLRTGEEIWYSPEIGVQNITKGTLSPYPEVRGQLFDYESLNQHGVIPGVIWEKTGSTWKAYDALTGSWIYTLTNVPSGHEVYTDRGEIVQYVLDYTNRWLGLWNNTQDNVGLHRELGYGTNAYQWRPLGKTVDMSNAYSWNVTIPDLPGLSSPSIIDVIPGDLILGTSSSFNYYDMGTPDPYTFWAISDKKATRGQLLWIKNYSAPLNNETLYCQRGFLDSESRIFIVYDQENMQYTGYSVDDGSKVWGPTRFPGNDWDYHSRPGGGHPCHYGLGEARTFAYGNMYIAGYGGLVNAINMTTGDVLWTYGNGGTGNSTYSGLENPWGHYPTFISMVGDGKIYTFTSEHSITKPIYKGSKWRCIDAFTGEELWTISGYSERNMGLIADGYFVNFNEYDAQIYVIGKGPSKTTVTASPKVIADGSGVLIEGTVIDTAAGTKQNEQAARFPNGVPAMSDESMSEWMEYVYMQQPSPQDATGVKVHLTAIDPNGNFQDIGYATTDLNGNFGTIWTPPVPGEYHITATFEGTESYWPSDATTYFAVTEAPSPAQPIEPEQPTEEPTAPEEPTAQPTAPEEPTAQPTAPEEPTAQPTEPAEAPFITTETAIIAAVIVAVIVGIAAYWQLRKRK